MSANVIRLNALAEELGLDPSHLRRWVLRRGYKPQRARFAESGGQETLVLTEEIAEAIRAERSAVIGKAPTRILEAATLGWFYAIQVVLDLKPERIKLGYADDAQRRLVEHRTEAPTAAILKSWPCRRHWEFTAIDCIARKGATRLLNEVYEFDSISCLIERADAFFALMCD